MNAKNPEPPRYLDHWQAERLRDAIDLAVMTIRIELLRGGAEERGLGHEIGIALARAACRYSLDPLDVAATTTIGRLEVLVAELSTRLEQRKIAQTIEDEARPREDRPSAYDLARAHHEHNGTNGVNGHVPSAACRCARCR